MQRVLPNGIRLAVTTPKRMNPFGIFQAVLVAFEAAADRLNLKRKREIKRENRRFLFWYFLFLFLAAAVVVWVVYELYFAK